MKKEKKIEGLKRALHYFLGMTHTAREDSQYFMEEPKFQQEFYSLEKKLNFTIGLQIIYQQNEIALSLA